MAKITSLLAFLSRYKYYITIIIGVVVVVFVGNNSIYHSIELEYEIMDLKAEIEKYNKTYEAGKQQLRDLERDPRNIERIARECYFMKADDEDIFVLSTDPRNIETPNTEQKDEATE